MSTRAIIAGDLLALFAFALLGLASHEHEVTPAALARTFVPFAVAWLAVGGAASLLRPDADGRPQLGLRFLAAYLIAGITALVARSVIFDRTLLNAFFVIALVGNGLFLFAWRALCGRWLAHRSSSIRTREATPS
jgi:hypothetical protein